MTRKRFDYIQREWEQSIKCQVAFDGVVAPLLLWGETIRALEEAWGERDAAIRQRDERALRAAGLMYQVEAFRKGHDRYEIARRLSPAQWADIWKLNISTGKPFDEIIDDLRRKEYGMDIEDQPSRLSPTTKPGELKVIGLQLAQASNAHQLVGDVKGNRARVWDQEGGCRVGRDTARSYPTRVDTISEK